jgi:hypothetical protein
MKVELLGYANPCIYFASIMKTNLATMQKAP